MFFAFFHLLAALYHLFHRFFSSNHSICYFWYLRGVAQLSVLCVIFSGKGANKKLLFFRVLNTKRMKGGKSDSFSIHGPLFSSVVELSRTADVHVQSTERIATSCGGRERVRSLPRNLLLSFFSRPFYALKKGKLCCTTCTVRATSPSLSSIPSCARRYSGKKGTE